MREGGARKINYTAIAIKGLLYDYKPTHATVEVDGKEYSFKKVWLAPIMYGRFYGGGMMPAPEQHRGRDKLSVTVIGGLGRLRTLLLFPSIFTGKHTKLPNVSVFSGDKITVTFNRPTTIQIDGEMIKNVITYTAYSSKVTTAKPEMAVVHE